jgi:hypothetical protein
MEQKEWYGRNGVVLIPAWRRPEMLWHCLANIKRAEGADRLHYIFRFDQGHSPELHDVIRGFEFSHEVSITPPSKYLLTKQSYSLLTGYALAVSKCEAGGLVFMIEEDVMVATDFFRFHQEVHEQPDKLFCSIAVANPNRHGRIEGPAQHYYLSDGDYCSLGVAFPREVLRDVVLHHANPAYYAQPHSYCRKNWPKCPIGDAFAEQDGLIRRIQMGGALPIAYPLRPRAYHAGLYGKNRGAGPSGSFAKRLEYVTEVIYSDEAMRTFAKHPEWYEDSRPIDLQADPWSNLERVTIREDLHPVRF